MRFASSGPLPIRRVRPGLDPRPLAVRLPCRACSWLVLRLLLSQAAAHVAEPGGPWPRHLGPCGHAVQASSWLGEDSVLPSGVFVGPGETLLVGLSITGLLSRSLALVMIVSSTVGAIVARLTIDFLVYNVGK